LKGLDYWSLSVSPSRGKGHREQVGKGLVCGRFIWASIRAFSITERVPMGGRPSRPWHFFEWRDGFPWNIEAMRQGTGGGRRSNNDQHPFQPEVGKELFPRKGAGHGSHTRDVRDRNGRGVNHGLPDWTAAMAVQSIPTNTWLGGHQSGQRGWGFIIGNGPIGSGIIRYRDNPPELFDGVDSFGA